MKENAIEELKESFDVLQQMVKESTADKSLYTGIAKMSRKLKSLSRNQISSALCKFGSPQFQRLQKSSKLSVMRRSQKSTINVQPSSVQRRKRKNGSKKAVRVGGSRSKMSNDLPRPLTQRKREHNISSNISNGVLPAKKHSKDMTSMLRPNVKKSLNKGKKTTKVQ